MKKLQLLSLAAALAQAASASPAPDVTLRVTPDREYVYRLGPREMIVQVEIEARKSDDTRRAPMNLAIVLDRSGSMEGAKIEKARQAAAMAVDKLGDDDFFSLVTYDSDTDLLIPPERVGSRDHREELKARIHRIQPGGSTALHAGVVLGAKQVRRFFEKERVNRVILLSDGIANVGPSSTSDLARLGRELRSDGIAVSTIGLGDDYNEDLMTALAEASNANYYYVKDAEKLPGIFAEELGAARSLLARSIVIRINAPEGVRLKEIIGRPDIECRDRVVEIKMPELFGSEKRRFLVRCVAEGKDRGCDRSGRGGIELRHAGRRRRARATAGGEDRVHRRREESGREHPGRGRAGTWHRAEPPRQRDGGEAGGRRQGEGRGRRAPFASGQERSRARADAGAGSKARRIKSSRRPRAEIDAERPARQIAPQGDAVRELRGQISEEPLTSVAAALRAA